MGISKELAAYRENAVERASPIELVIMLCDALVKDLKLTAAAIRAHDIEERVNQSNHAFSVLQELDLLLDFNNGGTTAKELARVYSHVRGKLIESQIKLDPKIVESQMEFIQQIREAWQQALSASGVANTPAVADVTKPPFEAIPYPYADMGEEARMSNWSA